MLKWKHFSSWYFKVFQRGTCALIVSVIVACAYKQAEINIFYNQENWEVIFQLQDEGEYVWCQFIYFW